MDDFLVGLTHTHTGKSAHIGDGVFHAFGNNAVTAIELFVLHLHLHTQQPGLHGGGDFGCATRLGTVTDHAGVDGYCVDNGVGDFSELPTVEIGDALSLIHI